MKLKYFLASDWHFGHNNMVERCGRPEDFSERIYANTKQVLKTQGLPDLNNIFVFLGDASLYEAGKQLLIRQVTMLKEFCRSVVLVRGNHDPRPSKAYELGWDFVCDQFEIETNGVVSLFTHVPETTLLGGRINIFGHLHNTGHRGELIDDGQHILLACEYMDYRPIELSQALVLAKTPVWNGQKFIGLTPRLREQLKPIEEKESE